MSENPVSDVLRIVRGQKEIVLSAKITVASWTFCAIRRGKGHYFDAFLYYGGDQALTEPPNPIIARAHEIAGGVFSDIRIVRPVQGVLIPK